MGRRCFWIFTAFALLLSAPMALSESEEKSFTVDNLIQIQTITDTQISPDGSHLLYVLSYADLGDNSYHSQIWMVGTQGGPPVQFMSGANVNDSPRWAPDGKIVAFASDRDGKRQIWQMARFGGDAKKLTNFPSDVISFEWSPDGKKIAFLASDLPAQYPKEGVSGNAQVQDKSYAMEHIHLVDVQTGTERQLTTGNFAVEDLSWSPDSQQIAFAYRPTLRTLDDFKTDIYLVRVKDGAIRPLVKRDGRDDTPRWSPDGSQVAFLSTDGSVQEFHSVHVFVVPAAGGEPRNVSASVGERIYGLYGWSSDSEDIFFRVRQGTSMQLLAASAVTGEVTKITDGEKVYDSFSFSRAAPMEMAFVATDAKTPKDLYISPVKAFHPAKLVTSNPMLAGFRFGQTKLIRWKSKGNVEIEGILIFPVAYKSGERYPLLTIVHGGPSGAFTIGFAPQLSAIPVPLTMDAYFPELFAEQGYAVFMPNIRGSGGYGDGFRRADVEDWGGADFADIMTGIDFVIEQGIADGNRLGIMGWSYGGYMTAWAISQTNRFKAASVGAGVSDLYSMYGTCEAPDQIEAYFGGPPWQRKQLYDARSAITFAGRIRTPTLLLHGEKDLAVPLGQAQELYRALFRQSIPVELVVYPRSGHDPTEPKQNMDVWRRNLEWFNRWVKANGQ